MDIVHDPAGHQFRVEVDGHLGVVDYTLRDGAMIITHTEVPSSIGGRCIAAELTRTALDTARRKGSKVVPACSYAAAFIRRHPEFAGLLA
ncbi:MAG TPA: GNAT family N-acetyltransferase [Rhodanobacteraceae bacterium]|nr:GNAT family N-acetyltransferase [Rhodanobacteraceae bacterium]